MSVESSPAARVSAIVVSHNGARWLPEVVAAISSQVRPPDNLCAVDTGSHDGSVELLRNSRIDVLEIAGDSGFGGAISAALSQLPPIEPEVAVEWLWLLHDDCAPAPEALAALLEAVAARPNVGVAGPKILGWHDRSHLLEIGVTIAHNGARWTGLERNERDQGQHDGDGALPVLAVSTAGALIRRDLFEEIGGFDENLPLFRDDVDFGMRAHMAGYSIICVTSAKLFHAEAAATERRAIDVAGGAFHRPHLLDRRHAAFVLLANLPLWTLPWITLRIFVSAIMRAAGYLLVKLPGYALDELAAVALLFTRLDRLRSARQMRRKNRLLPARVIRPLLAPWSEQIKLGALRIRDLLLRRVERVPEPVVGNVFSDTDDSDDGELLAPVHSGFWRQSLTKPLVITALPLLLLSLVASRSRFGSLSGGALAQVGPSAFDYLEFYGQSWHSLGIGSGRISHPFTALLALLAASTGGNPALFIAIAFATAPFFALLTMYLFLRRTGVGKWNAALSGLMYATSALLFTSLDSGFVSTVILIIFLPLIALVALPIFTQPETAVSWRRISVITIALGLTSAISFQILISALLFALIHLIYLRVQGCESHVLTKRALIYSATVCGSFIMLAPWSLSNILNPSQFLVDQGAPAPIGSGLRVLLGNLQPFGHAPSYVMSATLLIGVVALFSRKAFLDSLAILSSIFLAALVSSIAVTSVGNSLSQRIWPGGFLVLAIFFASRSLAILSEGRLQRLRNSSFGRSHFATVAVVIFTGYCLAANTLWFISSAPSAPVKANYSSVLPPFIATATENADRPKTLILRSSGSVNSIGAQSFSYVVLRERDVRFGEISSLPNESPILTRTISEITAGAGDAPAANLAQFGIRYLYLEDSRRNKALARKIDGIGGLTRLSATPDGILWEVSGLTSRIRFQPSGKKVEADAEAIEMPSELVGGEFDLPSAGRVNVAEAFDSRWRILHAGRIITPKETQLGLMEFEIPESGRAVLFHDGTLHRAGISLQLATLGLLLFLALPRGRKQSEFTDEEVA